VPALEGRPGLRVVADPAALDAAHWAGHEVLVLRLAPDEALGLGATGVEVDDPHAIVEVEAGFATGLVDVARVVAHIEWSLPAGRPTLAQGAIAGVPARLWLTEDRATLVVHAAYAADLQDRLR
jgi:hypothetical protein